MSDDATYSPAIIAESAAETAASDVEAISAAEGFHARMTALEKFAQDVSGFLGWLFPTHPVPTAPKVIDPPGSVVSGTGPSA